MVPDVAVFSNRVAHANKIVKVVSVVVDPTLEVLGFADECGWTILVGNPTHVLCYLSLEGLGFGHGISCPSVDICSWAI